MVDEVIFSFGLFSFDLSTTRENKLLSYLIYFLLDVSFE